MQGPLFQSIALTLWGNACLGGNACLAAPTAVGFRDAVSDPVLFPPDHSTVRRCASVRFITLRQDPGHWAEQPCANTPTGWLNHLRTAGVQRLRLHRVDGMDAVPPAEGKEYPPERWLIEAVGPDGSDIWQARWHRAEACGPAALSKTDGDKTEAGWSSALQTDRIWAVTYGRIATGFRPPPGDLIHPGRLTQSFSQTLQRCLDLAHCHDQATVLGSLDLARRKLGSQTPEVGLPYPDLFPPGLCLPAILTARQLLACAQTLWELPPEPDQPETAATMTDAERAEWHTLRADLQALQAQAVLYAANLDLPSPVPAGPPRRQRRRWWPFG